MDILLFRRMRYIKQQQNMSIIQQFVYERSHHFGKGREKVIV